MRVWMRGIQQRITVTNNNIQFLKPGVIQHSNWATFRLQQTNNNKHLGTRISESMLHRLLKFSGLT